MGVKDVAAKENKLIEKTFKDSKGDKPSLIPVINQDQSRVTRARSKSLKGNEEPLNLVDRPTAVVPESSKVLRQVPSKPVVKVTRRSKSLTKRPDSKENEKKTENLPLSSISISEEESMYQTAHSTPILEHLKEEHAE